MTDGLRFRISGLRLYLHADGFITGNWRVSKDFSAELDEVLERVIRSAMRSAEARGRHFLLPSDLDRADLALRVAEQVSKIDRGMPRSNDVVRIPPSIENVGSYSQDRDPKSAIRRDPQ